MKRERLLLQTVMLIQHAGRVGRLRRVVLRRFAAVARWRQAIARVDGARPGAARPSGVGGYVVRGQTVGAFGEMLLNFLVALGQLLHQMAVLLKWVTTSF